MVISAMMNRLGQVYQEDWDKEKEGEKRDELEGLSYILP